MSLTSDLMIVRVINQARDSVVKSVVLNRADDHIVPALDLSMRPKTNVAYALCPPGVVVNRDAGVAVPLQAIASLMRITNQSVI